MQIFTYLPQTQTLLPFVHLVKYPYKDHDTTGILLGYRYHDYMAPVPRYFNIKIRNGDDCLADHVELCHNEKRPNVFWARRIAKPKVEDADLACFYIKGDDTTANVSVLNHRDLISQGRYCEGALIPDDLSFKDALKRHKVSYSSIVVLHKDEPLKIRYKDPKSKRLMLTTLVWRGGDCTSVETDVVSYQSVVGDKHGTDKHSS